MNKKRKIIDVTESSNHFNVDIRISIPKTQISDDLIQDLLIAKKELLEGEGNQIHYVRINQDENGNDLLGFEAEYFYGV